MNLSRVKIETDRLILVPIATKHAHDIFREFTAEITKYMFSKPADDISETKEFISRAMGNLKNGNGLQMTVLLKSTNEFLGYAGLHEISTGIPELGLWIKKSAHNNGYGSESIRALKKWAEENLDHEYLLYPVDESNVISRKIPEKLGGKIIGKSVKNNQSGINLYIVNYKIPKG